MSSSTGSTINSMKSNTTHCNADTLTHSPLPPRSNNSTESPDRRECKEVTIKNDSSTVAHFRFINDGNKTLKTDNGSKCKYYKCKDKGCKARYTTTKTLSGETSTTYLPEPHNHQPPERPRTRKEVKFNYFEVGVTPSVAHKHLVNNAPLPLSSADVPSIGQLKSWKYRNVMDRMPSGITYSMHIPCT